MSRKIHIMGSSKTDRVVVYLDKEMWGYQCGGSTAFIALLLKELGHKNISVEYMIEGKLKDGSYILA